MCKLIRLLFIRLPLSALRAWLYELHIAGCPQCLKEWELGKGTEESFAMPDWIKEESSLWPHIQEKIGETDQLPARPGTDRIAHRRLRWQWALAGLIVFLVAATFLVFYRGETFPPVQSDVSYAFPTPQINITRAKIQGKTAKPFIYHADENIFIWFDELGQEED